MFKIFKSIQLNDFCSNGFKTFMKCWTITQDLLVLSIWNMWNEIKKNFNNNFRSDPSCFFFNAWNLPPDDFCYGTLPFRNSSHTKCHERVTAPVSLRSIKEGNLFIVHCWTEPMIKLTLNLAYGCNAHFPYLDWYINTKEWRFPRHKKVNMNQE